MRVESTAVSSTKCGYKEMSCLQVNGFTAAGRSRVAEKMEREYKQIQKLNSFSTVAIVYLREWFLRKKHSRFKKRQILFTLSGRNLL